MAYEAVLIPLAAGMVAATAFLVRMCADSRTTARAAGSVFLLAMMAAMLLGGLVYVLNRTTAGLVDALWVTSATMSLAVVPIFLQFLRDARRQIAEGGTGYAAQPFQPTVRFALLVVFLVLTSEFLMGLVFTLASGVALASLTTGEGNPATSLLVNVVLSPWFVLTMAGEMALTVGLLGRRMASGLPALLAGQAILMVLVPTAVPDTGWPFVAFVGGAVVMTGIIVYVMEHLYRTPSLPGPFAGYLLPLLLVYAAMMIGVFLWQIGSTGLVLAAALVAEMILYFDRVVRATPEPGAPLKPWLRDARWTTGVLAAIFVGELFMGAILDQALLPQWFGSLGLAALGGNPAAALTSALTNAFLFLAATTASVWFLAMMGAEMGLLVVYRWGSTRSRETRIRFALMLGSYAAFAVFFPSLYYSQVFPQSPNPSLIPLLGWSMGIGSAPLAPAVLGAVVATYAATAILSMAFGRRWLCSAFCTAPLMYQGTTIDAMKTFNRSSPFAHRYLGSRFSTVYSVTIGVTMAALLSVSVLSYLDATGRLSVMVLGLDPTMFLFSLSFGVLWYVGFVLIPYAGNYNCVTMGWCYTGIIAQAFHRVGVFKLKVRDRKVCRACTTLDCARGCPVGLVDMPGHFRTKGEFRSSKCCGVGDCVEACPYGNLYIHDIRHVVARWLGRDIAGPRRLPVLPGPPIRTPSPPAPSLRTSPGTAPPAKP
ncbi:MAG: hypothetical protein QXG65_00400 [Thermoplasmata archaeon]